ncbi:choice-of-anchor K domain-containing protein [Calothrix sp. PCC 6303]|uniref:choice-of-anchor K domain-containing protein n=1 Tax=Calothrix sp. PCC 6303 TaxID=1170562 RepID=UPI0002A059ED|nr:choice-of-anchor K domain-containing protein [Calothrix sp. PCC 6303]AFZ00203.1 hypothetical protein Cal6303_1141 [Calothrix sp. PCC 6303]
MKLYQFLITAFSTFTVAAVAEVTLSTPIRAITFSGASSGVWGKPDPGSTNNMPRYTGVGTDSFTWGDPDDSRFGTPANSFKFAGNSFTTNVDSLFKIGDLTYFNGSVLFGTSVDKVSLSLNVGLNSPNKENEIFDFDFNLRNTPNTSENEIENADFAYITPKLDNRTFAFNGKKYTLELTGFSQDGGKTNLKEFRVLEGATTTAAIYGKISALSPVKPPARVPESGVVGGLSCLGIYMLTRRKKFGQ